MNSLVDSQEAVEQLLAPESRQLYVFFGGMAAGIVIPPFEFYNSAKILEHNKMFVRDFAQSWYHTGLPGISQDIPGTVAYLRRTIDALAPERTYFVGNSMGGFAAMLFAGLTGVGEVIAFAPQTFISPWLRWRHGDRRWRGRIARTYRRSMFKPRVWDLKPLLEKQADPRPVSLFVSTDDELDHIHATHLADTPGVQIFARQGGGHDIVRTLRDSGELPAIMAGRYRSA
ncbi:alpha/beta hydrolase [Oleiagrimonas sp. C23AA]|uniref:alpha/beta fold hydrolase n=1 Tax=Oleiagrimonas sp. C23AA TaxID=2719047 RepID=UPI0014248D01|nr:alpha/beta hydrolase [Oleiagrimonas sp. C23AA]NII12136.1 alpha/beta hydrolase [Oleiagrimonas sp. C23AA]